MSHPLDYDTNLYGATAAWLQALKRVTIHGTVSNPRGMATKELLHRNQVTVDMRYPAVNMPERKLNKQFMAREALWILAGDNRVAPLAELVPRMREFSDDGIILAGAYGPRVVAQLDYAINTLMKDPDTRQAVIGIWERNPPPSKDIPCTLALVFSIRQNKLFCHAHMRSSDIWLGLPYDIFSFSMVATRVACALNQRVALDRRVELGSLTISATSSHLYAKDFLAAGQLLRQVDELDDRVGSGGWVPNECEPVPFDLVATGNWGSIEACLVGAAEGHPYRTWSILPTSATKPELVK